MRVLLTGGAGFLGWHTAHALLSRPGVELVVNLDLLTYAGSTKAIRDLQETHGARHRFMRGDVREPDRVRAAMADVDTVIHLAAETHVDRSVTGALPFVSTNVLGTQVLLDAAREAGIEKVVHASTDEVYGHLPLDEAPEGHEALPFREESPLQPRSPYAASKAGADHLAQAAFRTHGVPVVIIRSSNGYGPAQFPEKLIPLAISRIREGIPVPLYGSGLQVREWIHARDQADGIVRALERGVPGRVYNLGGGEAWTNLDLVKELLRVMDAPPGHVEFVGDRPGHDQRYALSGERADRELGWRPTRRLTRELPGVVAWYEANAHLWWRRDERGDVPSR